MLLVDSKGQSLAPFRNINQRYHPKERGRKKRPLWWQFRLKLICPLAEILKVFALDFSSPPHCSCFFPKHTLPLLWAGGAREPALETDMTSGGMTSNGHKRPHHRVHRAISTYTDPGLCLAPGLTEREGVTNINLRPGSQRTQVSFSHMGISEFPLAATINCGPKL